MPRMETTSVTHTTQDGATGATSAPTQAGRVKQVARVQMGERLARLFEETTRPDGQRWTMTYLADELRARGQDVSRQYLGYLLTGERDEPRLSLVEALADVFQVPVAYFTADYLGRVTSDLLPLLALLHDPHIKALLTRADLAETAAVLADPEVAQFVAAHPLAEVIATLRAPVVQSAVEDTLAQWAQYGIRR